MCVFYSTRTHLMFYLCLRKTISSPQSLGIDLRPVQEEATVSTTVQRNELGMTNLCSEFGFTFSEI